MTKRKSDVYQMTTREQGIVKKRAADRAGKSPSMKIVRGRVGPDHPDLFVGYELAFEEMGVDFDVGMGLLSQMIKVATCGAKIDLKRLNFLLSFVKSLKPRDVLEAVLISQIAVGHMRYMEADRRAQIAGDAERELHERRAAEFMRIFIRQMETLKHYRSNGEQKIVVQKMTVSDGGQAIVGNVTKHEAPREGAALPHDKTKPMLLRKGDAVKLAKGASNGEDDE